MVKVVEDQVAVSERHAAELSGISVRRLRAWDARGLVGPSIKGQLSERNTVRLYTFEDLVELLVASALVEAGRPPRHMRRVVEDLRDRDYEAPLRELRFAVSGDRIYLQHPDGLWEGDQARDQVVLYQVLDLEAIKRGSGGRCDRAVSTRPAMWSGAVVCSAARRCLPVRGCRWPLSRRIWSVVFLTSGLGGVPGADARGRGGWAAVPCQRVVRFLLDNDVDPAVASLLRGLGHEVAAALRGLGGAVPAVDDEVTVYATGRGHRRGDARSGNSSPAASGT